VDVEGTPRSHTVAEPERIGASYESNAKSQGQKHEKGAKVVIKNLFL